MPITFNVAVGRVRPASILIVRLRGRNYVHFIIDLRGRLEKPLKRWQVPDLVSLIRKRRKVDARFPESKIQVNRIWTGIIWASLGDNEDGLEFMGKSFPSGIFTWQLTGSRTIERSKF